MRAMFRAEEMALEAFRSRAISIKWRSQEHHHIFTISTNYSSVHIHMLQSFSQVIYFLWLSGVYRLTRFFVHFPIKASTSSFQCHSIPLEEIFGSPGKSLCRKLTQKFHNLFPHNRLSDFQAAFPLFRSRCFSTRWRPGSHDSAERGFIENRNQFRALRSSTRIPFDPTTSHLCFGPFPLI